jgi:hypothetical protein
MVNNTFPVLVIYLVFSSIRYLTGMMLVAMYWMRQHGLDICFITPQFLWLPKQLECNAIYCTSNVPTSAYMGLGLVRSPSNQKIGSKGSRAIDFASRFVFLTDPEI